MAFHPPLLLLSAIVVGFVARWLAPLSLLPVVIAGTVGPIISGVSLALFFWAVYSMRSGGASIPTGEPTETIILSGPYRFSRNPIYLAMLLLQIGIGVWANSLWFLLLAALSIALLVWGVISREELYLERKFGADYVAYKTQVRRWV